MSTVGTYDHVLNYAENYRKIVDRRLGLNAEAFKEYNNIKKWWLETHNVEIVEMKIMSLKFKCEMIEN